MLSTLPNSPLSGPVACKPIAVCINQLRALFLGLVRCNAVDCTVTMRDGMPLRECCHSASLGTAPAQWPPLLQVLRSVRLGSERSIRHEMDQIVANVAQADSMALLASWRALFSQQHAWQAAAAILIPMFQ